MYHHYADNDSLNTIHKALFCWSNNDWTVHWLLVYDLTAPTSHI